MTAAAAAASPPGPPVPFSAPLQIADRTLRFLWTAPHSSGSAPITTYELSVFSQEEGEREYRFHTSALQFLIPGSEMFYDVSGLTNGHIYNGAIKASNDNGVTWGEEVAFPPQYPIGPPPTPVRHAAAYRTGPTTAMVIWVSPPIEPDPATAYFYVETVSENPVDEVLSNKTENIRTYRIGLTGLNPSSTYAVNVYVKNSAGQSIPFLTNRF